MTYTCQSVDLIVKKLHTLTYYIYKSSTFGYVNKEIIYLYFKVDTKSVTFQSTIYMLLFCTPNGSS